MRGGEVLCFLVFWICLCKSGKLLIGIGGWAEFPGVDARFPGAGTSWRIGVWLRVAVSGRAATLCDILE